ncbi:hypothetical protein V6N13_061973 [Hibiscus sabdariffa]
MQVSPLLRMNLVYANFSYCRITAACSGGELKCTSLIGVTPSHGDQAIGHRVPRATVTKQSATVQPSPLSLSPRIYRG